MRIVVLCKVHTVPSTFYRTVAGLPLYSTTVPFSSPNLAPILTNKGVARRTSRIALNKHPCIYIICTRSNGNHLVIIDQRSVVSSTGMLFHAQQISKINWLAWQRLGRRIGKPIKEMRNKDSMFSSAYACHRCSTWWSHADSLLWRKCWRHFLAF